MWVRNSVLVAAAFAAVTISSAAPAQAQGPKQPAAPVTGATLPAVDHVFTPPAVLGEAWAQAVRAVVDGVKHLVDMDKVVTEKAVRPQDTPRPPAKQAPVIPTWRAAWTPASALRETISKSPVQVGPVAVAPPAETGRDTRGEHAVLLGARMELPWRVP